MKKITFIVAAVAIIMIFVSISVIITNNNDENTILDKGYYEIYAIEKAQLLTNGSLIIVADIEEDETIILPSNVRIQDNLESIERNDTVMIDGSWARFVEKKGLYEAIDQLAYNNNPIIVMDGTPSIIKGAIGNKYATSFTDEGEVFCFFYDGVTSHCHSIDADSIENSLFFAYEWSNEVLSNYIYPYSMVLCL